MSDWTVYRAARPPVDRAVIFVASRNPRYRSAVAWARTADKGAWRTDTDRGGIWVARAWAGDDQRVYGPFDKQRELPYDSSSLGGAGMSDQRHAYSGEKSSPTGASLVQSAVTTRPASAGHRFQQLDAPVMGRRWDDM